MKSNKIQKMTITAVLSALILLMTFTGFGYIPIGPLKLTLNVLPVAVGAVLLGPKSGLFLGGVFGLSSFLTCFGIDAFGAILLSLNPFSAFVVCMIPRLLCGWLPALIYKFLKKYDKKNLIAPAVACISTAIINTLLFLGFLWICFGNDIQTNEDIINMMGGNVINSFAALTIVMAGVNAIIESLTAFILGTAIIKALNHIMKISA